ncbi:MAG: ribonuclease J [Deltaproteobacteria bacterium]
MKPGLKFIPIGGLGEIGMNLMVLEYGADAVIVDCGVMFPEATQQGVDLILPDFSYLRRIKNKIRALLLTHGHEDHIGAVPFLLREINPPVYGSPFTLALIEGKLKEHNISAKLHRVSPNHHIKVGAFQIEFLQVSHSIVDGMGLAIETPAGMVIHTADFKIDDDPYHGRRITLRKFEEYGKKGALLLLSDSTNVEREGKSLTENQIHEEIFKLCKQAQGRIIFSVFATNIRRIEQVLDIARRLKRKVALSGRSILNNVPIARRLGFISPSSASVLIDLDQLGRFKDEGVIVICTGSQAEHRSALWRMSVDEHREIRINPRDTVILSSRFIPGNERMITHLINNLSRKGATVFYEKVAQVHVSGHAYAGELRRMIAAVRPKFFIPVHGEFRHLKRHAELAEGMKIARNLIFICEDAQGVLFSEGRAERLEPLDIQRVYIESETYKEVSPVVVKERRQISEGGVVFVFLIRDKKRREIIWGPILISKGIMEEEKNRELLRRIKQHLFNLVKQSHLDLQDLEEEVRIHARRYLKHAVGKKPLVLTQIIDL